MFPLPILNLFYVIITVQVLKIDFLKVSISWPCTTSYLDGTQGIVST